MIELLLAAGASAALLWYGLTRRWRRPHEPFRDFERFAGLPIAHKGLAGPHAPDNSLSAFDRAARSGMGIELDVRACRDGLVIMHDRAVTLDDGSKKRVSALTYRELAAVKIGDGAERIPSFRAALESVAGRVPLVIELKATGLKSASELARGVANELKGYAGLCCVESFNPWALRACRFCMPHVARGQLVASYRRMRSWCGIPLGHMLADLSFNALSRPAFVSLCTDAYMNRGVKAWRAHGGRCAVWTLTDPSEVKRVFAEGDMLIFEGRAAAKAAAELYELKQYPD